VSSGPAGINWIVARGTGQAPYKYYDLPTEPGWNDSEFPLTDLMYIASSLFKDPGLFAQIPAGLDADMAAFTKSLVHLLVRRPPGVKGVDEK
jgi:hypothetical protein